MKWKFYPKEKPEDSGTFIVSLVKDGEYFNYIAWYDVDDDVWFRQNPFNHQENVIELDLQIVAWASVPVHI
ncbi:hypothetical protein [Elizabethkingia meningoseptica]|uniref:hypothetical protein n=1 Tax=Elizabethkingia meningoseptica TaxID=238 RepID=UPI00162A096D|nr:hypothetical protein [Elizabethkingia meningoseptica]MBG0512962.1 hypothetical protein [Elizabethkingia meningoseptica]